VSKWGKFRALSRDERWLLLEAFALLPAAKRALRLGALRHLPRPAPGGKPARAQAAEEAQRVARMVAAAARNGPWRTTCLEQSLVLLWLLNRRGIPARLRIGVRKEEGELEAHAWIESGGVVLNDTADVSERYRPFEGDLAELFPFQASQLRGDRGV
jgi:Transglutaminase-like superfamily